MEHKNSMSRVERLHREKVTRYSIRKYSFGAASVAVAALFMFLGNGAVSANELSKQDTPSVEAPALNKTQLESYISEIETKLSNGSYDNKTEESVGVLKADLESAKATLANATTQAQLTEAYNKLVTTVSSKLKNKPVEKKETPAVDTTEGKPTVGKKAENTEKNSDSNSIENTGSKDPRNGKEMDEENALRTETSKTVDNITYTAEFSNDTTKEIYVYNKEEANVEFKINSSTNKVTYAEVTQASNQKFKTVNDTTVTDGYGYNFNKITTETDTPLTVRMTGQPNDTIMGNRNYTKTEDQNFAMGDRYLRITAKDGSTMSTNSSGANADGYFRIVLKSQTYKYSIKLPESNADKIGVNDINSLTPADITKIKNEIKIQYSDKATREDARLASKKGEVVNPRSSVVKEIAVANGTVTVTYNDDSVDTAPVSSVARTNQAPTVEIPFSVDGKKDVYVYANEDFELPIKFKDDSGKVASATITRGGNVEQPPKDASNPNILNNEFNTTVEKISTETVATAETPAIVKIKGNISKDNSGIPASSFPKTAEGELKIVTRYATATDTDGAYIKNTATEQAYASDPGSFTIKLKAQTAKYDIKDPETKVTVANANNITEDEFNQIKDSIKIQYSTTNPDKNLLDKQGKAVDNQAERIESITREGNNVVVTYKDGSKDTKALADFVNVAPTVELPYSNQTNKEIYVYSGENTDLTFKGSDENEVKDLYLRGPGDVKENNANKYGFTTGKVENGVVTGEGSVSEDKRTATIKMTGTTNLTAGKAWTSFIVSKDNDGKLSNTDYRALDVDKNAKEKPGYARFVVKNQTSKYDIAAPTEKVAVADPAKVTDAELDKIKEKLQIEYSNNNDDANLADKKGKTVDAADAKTKIKSVEKDNAGNLVVTYTDDSTDKKPLSDFVTLDKQPAIEAVEKAAEAQIAAINNTPNATDAEKTAAIAKVNADKEKALAEIAKPEVTTKEAVDAAKTAGTGEIAKENPVAKEAAKKAIDDALK
ncbi:Gram-positive signal peptide protein, YSIRK family, partial [Streptococcus mitis SK579]